MPRLSKYLLATLMLVAASCGARDPQNLGDVEYQTASGATKTVETVAADPAMKRALPDHSAILTAAASNLNASLQIQDAEKSAPETVGTPLVDAITLATDSSQAAVIAEEEAKVRNEAVKKEQEASWWDALREWGGWGIVGGVGLVLARSLGVPGVGLLTDPLIRGLAGRWIKPMEENAAAAEEKLQHFASTVEGSMAGRAGLKWLDSVLGDKLQGEIQRLTGGKAKTIDDVFKWLAKTHVGDGEHNAVAVGDLVDQIKDQMDTENGMPASVKLILSGLVEPKES